MKRITVLVSGALLAFSLVACGDKDGSEPASAAAIEKQTSDPVKAVESVAAKFKEGKLLEAMQLSLTPEDMELMRKKWPETLRNMQPDAEDKMAFAMQMGLLTAEGAENSLYTLLEPKLAQLETEMAAQMPFLVGMGQGFLIQLIQSNDEFNENQKKQLVEIVGGMAIWVQSTNFADRELAKKSIAIAVQTARKLKLKTYDDVSALSFEQGMGKASIAYVGLRDILALYGFDINQALSTLKAREISRKGDDATVSMTYNLFGKTFTAEKEMVEVNGRWYGKDVLNNTLKNFSDDDDQE